MENYTIEIMELASIIIVIATAIFCIIAGYDLISFYIKNRKKNYFERKKNDFEKGLKLYNKEPEKRFKDEIDILIENLRKKTDILKKSGIKKELTNREIDLISCEFRKMRYEFTNCSFSSYLHYMMVDTNCLLFVENCTDEEIFNLNTRLLITKDSKDCFEYGEVFNEIHDELSKSNRTPRVVGK